MTKMLKIKVLAVFKKKNSNIKTELTKELLLVNAYIDRTESYTAITAPESSLGIVLSEQKSCDIELKYYYVRKRKIMYLLDCLSDTHSFTCHDCGKTIELERLIVLPKAQFCEACITAKNG